MVVTTNPSERDGLSPIDQLVTTRPGRLLLKGEVLGSRNAKHTNNLIMESVRAHN